MNPDVSTQAFGLPSSSLGGADVMRLLSATGRVMVSAPQRKWRPSVVDRMEKLTALPVGWDGYRGLPVSFSTAEFALRVLDSVCAIDGMCPQVVPGSRGDLQIEWHTADGSIELHVIAPNRVNAFRTGFGRPDDERDLSNDFTDVVKWLEFLTRGDFASTTAAA